MTMRHILCQAKKYWCFWQKNPVIKMTGTCVQHTPSGTDEGTEKRRVKRAGIMCQAFILGIHLP